MPVAGMPCGDDVAVDCGSDVPSAAGRGRHVDDQ
jgi:hypothetical protein